MTSTTPMPVMSAAAAWKEDAVDVARPTEAHEPSVWGHFFVDLQPCFDPETRLLTQDKSEILKEEVRRLLQDDKDLVIRMRTVDAVQRVGVSYHFEEEIDRALDHLYVAPIKSDDLSVVALRFRLLRQAGYNISVDVFEVFKDEDGNFEETIGGDVNGLLSLYEAAYLATHGEAILDEAIKFCGGYLQAILDLVEPEVAVQISHALEIPLHRRVKRLEAKHYISIYEAMEGRNDSLLEFAKLDFNLLQSLHLEEIKNISVWWKELGLATKLKFARDKLVECYLWILGVHVEPFFSRTRIIMTKTLILISFLDDIYDAYGTIEELELFTDVLRRWDVGLESRLPEYLKIFLIAVFTTFKEFEDELVKEQHSYQVEFHKKGFIELATAYFKEARWRSEGYIPSLEVHLRISMISAAFQEIVCSSWIEIGEIATKEAFDWLFTLPKILEASSAIGRLMNDIVSYEREKKREHVASSIQCYMMEHDTSLEDTCVRIQEIIEDAWKDINQESLKPTVVPMPLLMPIINLARVSVAFYKDIDGYTYSSKEIKDHITSLIIQPIAI